MPDIVQNYNIHTTGDSKRHARISHLLNCPLLSAPRHRGTAGLIYILRRVPGEQRALSALVNYRNNII